MIRCPDRLDGPRPFWAWWSVSWRWPQISVFLATSALVAGTSLLAAYSDEVSPGMLFGTGALVAVMYVAAALVPDRPSPVVHEPAGGDD